MLNKNIYLLFPPGYSGTYVSWILSKSERHSRDSTVDDPVNKTDNKKYGGSGTSHLHVRVPTHHGLNTHYNWVAYNRPTEPMIYLINARDLGTDRLASSEEAVMRIRNYDPDAVFIHIHDGNDLEWRRITNINCITKWPVFFRSEQMLEKIFGFDCFDIDSQRTRNIFAQHREKIFPFNSPIDQPFLRSRLDWYRRWYEVRNEYNPHEVNETTYVVPTAESPPVFELHFKSIMNHDIFDFLENVVAQTQCGEYDFSHARSLHQQYINAQQSLQWLQSIKLFRDTGEIDEYVKSSSMAKILILEEMLPVLNANNVNWRDMTLEQCISDYSTKENAHV